MINGEIVDDGFTYLKYVRDFRLLPVLKVAKSELKKKSVKTKSSTLKPSVMTEICLIGRKPTKFSKNGKKQREFEFEICP